MAKLRMLKTRAAISVSRGVSLKKMKDRELDTPQYDAWRAAVIARAEGRCQGKWHKGDRRVATLFADHIKERFDRPDLLLDLANGQALCRSCHVIKTNEERRKRFLMG